MVDESTAPETQPQVGFFDENAPNTGIAKQIETQQSDTEGARIIYGPDEMNIGGRLVVGTPNGYNTIQEAIAAAEDGDIIYVHGSYDAQTAGETFPIQLDLTQKKISLTGGHPAGSEIDATGVNASVIEVLGTGQRDFENRALVSDLKLIGGNVGMRIRGVPYSTYRGLILFKNQSHGIEVDGYTSPEGRPRLSPGLNFIDCMAWSCRGVGFKLNQSAKPANTNFFGCHALFCGLYDGNNLPGVELRGNSSSFHGGTIQNNGAAGIKATYGRGQGLYNIYFEGNGMSSEYPQEIFLPGGSGCFTVRDCYFQGIYARTAPNGRSKGYHGIFVDSAHKVSINNSTYRNYEDALIFVSNVADIDLHRSSHLALDNTPFIKTGSNALRLRDNGDIVPTDLRGVSGLYVGDKGIHNGEGNYPTGLAVWNGNNWISQIDGGAIH